MNRPLGDYETEGCDMRLKDKLYEKALDAANDAFQFSTGGGDVVSHSGVKPSHGLFPDISPLKAL